MSRDADACQMRDLFELAGFTGEELAGYDQETVALAKALTRRVTATALLMLGQWIHGEGNGKPQGVMIRAHIAFWTVLPHLAELKQTELAELMGLRHKQSVGREVSDFRDRFGLRNGHMQSDAAREVCRQREAAKKGEL
jgi:hypothetical protein